MSDLSLRNIFEEALDRLPGAERSRFLDEACGSDPVRRQRVETLLKAHEDAGSFFADPSKSVLPKTTKVAVSEMPGNRIGRYKLLEQIGEGGCGVVYVAEQEEPVRRRVALKVIKLGMDTKQVIARFDAERQALAIMDHPNIAKVFDAGATETGRPYFVMELVRGLKITEFCDEGKLSPRERLELFIQVCRAIQHAHQKGVIHRDIKPSNILVTVNDGVPVPKVIDFGIAKATQGRLTDQTVYTAFEQFIGTPAYMSPEQAVMTSQDVDTRSDIYSLGVLLYELITGRTPFDAKQLLEAGLDEMRRTIREEAPPKPSTCLSKMAAQSLTPTAERRRIEAPKLIQLVGRDLDWIVMKCLEKDRACRYETATALAEDIERYFQNEPVTARPPSRAYRFQKLVRRHKVGVVTAALIGVFIAFALVTLVLSNVRVTRERNEKAAALRSARSSEQQAHNQLFFALRSQAQERRRSRRMGQRLESLATVREAVNLHRDDELRDSAVAALALPDLRPARRWRALGTNDVAVAFDANYERYARIDQQSIISLRTVADDREILRFASGPSLLPKANGRAFIFSPDGRFLAKFETEDRWSIWRLADAQLVLRSARSESAALAFSSDSTRAALALENSIVIFDLSSGVERTRWLVTQRTFTMAFSPDNGQLAVAPSQSEVVQIYEGAQGRLQTELSVGLCGERALAWHPSGEYLAVSQLAEIQLWDVNASAKVTTMDGHAALVTTMSFHPSGDWLMSDSWDGIPRLWQPSPGRECLRFFSGLNYLQFSKDGQYAGIVFSGAGNVQLIEFVPSEVYDTFLSNLGDNTHSFHPGDVSPDGRLLAMGSRAGISIRELPGGRELGWIPKVNATITRFHPNGRELMASGPHGLTAWPIATENGENGGAHKVQIGPARHIRVPSSCNEFSLTGDGKTLAVMSEALGKGWIVDLDSGVLSKQEFLHRKGAYIAITPDGKWLVTSGWHSTDTRLWDVQTGANVLTVPSDRARVIFSPDGREFVVSNSQGYTLFDPGTRKMTRRFEREGGMHFGWFAFSHDGKMMAMETSLGVISLCDAVTGRTIARLEDPGGNVGSWICFTPDGAQLIVVATMEKAIHRWDLRALRAELKPMGLDWDWPEFP